VWLPKVKGTGVISLERWRRKMRRRSWPGRGSRWSYGGGLWRREGVQR
jgi:hypothetical protein